MVTTPSERSSDDSKSLRQEMATRLGTLEATAAHDPMVRPIRRLAQEMSSRLKTNDLSLARMSALIAELEREAFDVRARRLGAYVGEVDRNRNLERLRTLFERRTRDENGRLRPFEAYAADLQRANFGLVVTAHPTFGISQEQTELLARQAVTSAKKQDADSPPPQPASAPDVFSGIDLVGEQEWSLDAIETMQGSIRQVLEIALDTAARVYPDKWHTFVPVPVTVASWVGYDLDGRADIRWTDSLRARLRTAGSQLTRYLDTVRQIMHTISDGEDLDPDLSPVLKLIESRLVLASRTVAEEIDSLPQDADDVEAVQVFAKRLVAGKEDGLTDVDELVDLVGRGMELTADKKHRLALAIFRAELATYGLGTAHIHVRLNATQLINAIRKLVGMESAPDDPGNRRSYMRALNGLLDDLAPTTVNFGSVMNEPTTAKRLFMLVAQILKFVDARTPIRFLIAECDTAFAALTALYFARLFGVDERIDISPLLETPQAIQHGHEIIAELISNPHYRDYVCRRGRICIQTGYSDAGRYHGQVAAALAIERLRIKLAHLLADRELVSRAEGGPIEIVIFDTHGESIGRGAHPESFQERLDYIATPASRAAFARHGIPVKQEVSFQGGDGFVYFADPDLSLATVCRLLEHALGPVGDVASDTSEIVETDLFYEDIDYSLEFFITVKSFNERVIDDPDYAALLNAFGTNMLYPTGSRMVRRQHDTVTALDTGHPSQIRAIPHNAILQQVGFMANSISGVGRAIAKDVDRFAEVYEASPRLRQLMSLVCHAKSLSRLEFFAAYIDLFDPIEWLRWSTVAPEIVDTEDSQRLARLLHESRRGESLRRMERLFLTDMIDLKRGLDGIGISESATRNPAERHCLALLHATRIAAIQEIFMYIPRIPRFSNLADATTDDVITRLLQLDVGGAVEILTRAFPAAGAPVDGAAFGEPADYRSDLELGYEQEHREIFRPLLQLHAMVRQASVAISHIMGAVG